MTLIKETLTPAEEIIKIINRIYSRDMTSTSGGNISIKDDNGDVWITPSAIDKGELKVSDICCIKNNGTIEGKHKPSSEYPFHLAIYRCRPDLKSVIHAHPPGLVAFSIIKQKPDVSIAPLYQNVCGEVGYAKYAVPGSELLGDNIADVFDSGYNSVIMESHGAVVGGENLEDAYNRFETLEFCSNVILNASSLGMIKPLTKSDISNYNHINNESSTIISSSEYKTDKQNLIKFINRACNHNLMGNSWGVASMRVSEDTFIINSSKNSRWDLSIDDILEVNINKSSDDELEKTVLLHKKIYQNNLETGSVVTSQSPNLMAFACSREKFDVRTIPESWIFLQDVPSIPFYKSDRLNPALIELFRNKTRGVIVENASVTITGENILKAYDYLEVAELSAKSLIMASKIGKLIPIGDRDIEDLRAKFLS